MKRTRIVQLVATGFVLAFSHAAGAADGEALFKQCKSCHQIGEGAKNRVGPQLNEIFDRRAAGVEGFKYSKSMTRAGNDGLTWTATTLDAYIENPKALISGTRMSYKGMKDPEDRAALLEFLRTYTASPADIPESAPTAEGIDHSVDPTILAIQGDPEYGAYLSSECVTCHQIDGGDKGIPSITFWPEEDFVVAMHAYRSKIRPHPVMQMITSRLSDEEIAALAAYFKDPEQ